MPTGLDQLVGNEDVFPVLAKRDYFNHAGVSPMPRPVAEAVKTFLDHFQKDALIGFDFEAAPRRLRTTAASVLNADEDEVALLHNTSEGVSQVALGLEFGPGDRIVTCDAEYPANVYPWMEVCRRTGAELVQVPETTDADGRVRVSEEALIAAADHPKTKLLAVSHVQWGSGQRMDLTKLGKFCHDSDILFSVDAIQSLGVVPIDVRRDSIDFLQAGGHKWMLGTMGAAPLFVRREVLDRLRPATVGWANVVNALRWEQIDYTLREDARRYEYGTPAMTAICATAEGLSLLNDAGIENVHARLKALGDRFASGVAEQGYRVVTPRDPNNPATCSGAVCFVPPSGDDDAAKRIHQTMAKEHQTELAFRCGRVRFSPHFYNTEAQIDRCLDRLASLAK